MVSTCHSRLIPAISRSFVNQYATLSIIARVRAAKKEEPRKKKETGFQMLKFVKKLSSRFNEENNNW